MNKFFILLLMVLFCAVKIYVALDFPATGDVNAPAATHVSPRYIELAYQETATRNMVCAVLADYRSFDTFGEVIVILIAPIPIKRSNIVGPGTTLPKKAIRFKIKITAAKPIKK
ncbi:hypothetical protein M1N68_01490 [Peptococcaceae bacterium]|nr:hypothetical protein [Peptococcaceae bacterium]